MNKYRLRYAAMAIAFLSISGIALPIVNDEVEVSGDVNTRMNVDTEMTAESTGLLGDSVNLSTGNVSFQVTDVAIPGNSALDVAVRRTWRGPEYRQALALLKTDFSDWSLDIPHIRTTLLSVYNSLEKKRYYSGGWGAGAPCSSNSVNPEEFLTAEYWEYWDGETLDIPGKLSERLLSTEDANYPRKTKSNYRVSCQPSTGEFGESFIVHAPDGTRYTLDKSLLVRVVGIQSKQHSINVYERYYAYMLVTRVEDRWGNWVSYNYTGDNLTSITSNDGRSITFTYRAAPYQNLVATVTANGKTWSYTYSKVTPSGKTLGVDVLKTVQLPNNKSWEYELYELSTPVRGEFEGHSATEVTRGECNGYPFVSDNIKSGTITHPNGATGIFTIDMRLQGRTEFVKQIRSYSEPVDYDINLRHKCFASYSVISKQLTGPSIGSLQWSLILPRNSGHRAKRLV